MPTYVHSYLRPVSGEPDRLVLYRSAAVWRALVVGVGGVAAGLGVAAANADNSQIRLALIANSVGAFVAAIAFLAFARAERVVFDRKARTLTLASGAVVPFAEIRQLVVLTCTDSDDDTAYGLGVDATNGTHTLSRMWCWNEARVRAAAAAIVAAFPDLPFAADTRSAP